MYIILIALAAFLVPLWLRLAEQEQALRLAGYNERLHASLLLYGVPGENGSAETLACELYRVNTLIGRRRRRCDICLDVYDDAKISREHALLWFDGQRFYLAPVYRPGSGSYTEILLNEALVPPSGAVLSFGESFYISGHELQLVNTAHEEEKAGWWE